MEIVETFAFTRQITALLSDEDYRNFQSKLVADPAAGVVLRGGNGIRKIRIAVGSRGKRGGARVIYYWAVRKHVILMLLAYSKSATADLTLKQVGHLAAAIKEEFGT